MIVLDFALTVLAAWILYRLVEVLTVRRFSNARTKKGLPPPAAPADETPLTAPAGR